MAPAMRWFDDFAAGQVFEIGDYLMTEEAVMAFAREFDPQPFHTDPEAAKGSIYGGLIASGWHTAAAMMRLMVDHLIPAESSLGSPGIDELRWLKPVRPGDRLRVRFTVLETQRSRSKPDRGMIRQLCEVLNQAGEVVMTCRGMGLFRARPADG
jgi:acyl dehydratase